MTKKDFELIAEIIFRNQEQFTEGEEGNSLLRVMSHQFANELENTNPRFNREKFLKECGV